MVKNEYQTLGELVLPGKAISVNRCLVWKETYWYEQMCKLTIKKGKITWEMMRKNK